MAEREARAVSRPLTASKAFALSRYANDTFRPFTIGQSRPSTHDPDNDTPANRPNDVSHIDARNAAARADPTGSSILAKSSTATLSLDQTRSQLQLQPAPDATADTRRRFSRQSQANLLQPNQSSRMPGTKNQPLQQRKSLAFQSQSLLIASQQQLQRSPQQTQASGVQKKLQIQQPDHQQTKETGGTTDTANPSGHDQRTVGFSQPLKLPHKPLTAPSPAEITRKKDTSRSSRQDANARAARKHHHKSHTGRNVQASSATTSPPATSVTTAIAEDPETTPGSSGAATADNENTVTTGLVSTTLTTTNVSTTHTHSRRHRQPRSLRGTDRQKRDRKHNIDHENKDATANADGKLKSSTIGGSIPALGVANATTVTSNNATATVGATSAPGEEASAVTTAVATATAATENMITSLDEYSDVGSSTLSSEIALFGRPRVPHDYHLGQYSHNNTCSNAPPGMVFKTIAFTQRHRSTTFGLSNRIPFLRALYAVNGDSSIRPTYPAAFHGPGGEGKQFALGLSLVGSAGDDRVLDTACTYGSPTTGEKQLQKAFFPTPPATVTKPDAVARVQAYARSIASQLPPDTGAPRHIREVVGFQEAVSTLADTPSPRPTLKSSQPAIQTQRDRSLPINTRYSANTEWKHATKVTVQAPTHSHFYMSEPDRLQHLAFTDNALIQSRQRYQAKLKHYVRDKNINSVAELLQLPNA